MDVVRYLFAIWRRTGGGAERALSQLSSTLAKQGHEVYLLQMLFSEHDYSISDKVNVIPYGNLPAQKNVFLRKISRICRYREVIKSVSPDFVIPFLGSVVTDCFFATRFCKCAFISTIRNNPAVDPDVRVLRWWRNTVNFLSDAVFVQNKAQKKYYPKFMEKKIFVVPNPVSEEYLRVERIRVENAVCCVASGRLVAQKNHAMLIHAFNKVRMRYPNMKLLIFGEGPLRKTLQAQIDELGAGEQIKLRGRVDNMRAELAKAHLYILTSDYEGMPNALMEAMAMGIPCISTDCPTGPSDLIEHYINGVLVPVGDANALEAELLYMIEHYDQVQDMGERAQQTILERYSPGCIAQFFSDECNRVAKGV